MNPLPVQPVKIHCPPPRRDILSRERLNGWLDRAAGGRVILIVAEAGFGKTTLLADWAHHAGRMTAWYRLEPDDRDWLTFLRHLVASGRELDPDFGTETLALLLALGPGGPTRQDLITSLAREMAEFGTRIDRGLTLIFDDYHVVDGCPDTDPIVRALLDRTGPGFSVVLASRSAPRLPIGRLRARGGVDSLDGEDLCFDVDETDRLFRDAYRHPLQPDIVADLCDRTEGWAALLTLVRTSLDEDGGPDPRTLVAQLSASGGDLYDFLAEEVLAGLQPDLQRFLMRVSVLSAVDVDTAVLVDDRPADEVAATIRHCENLGLLTRPDRESPHRFHPLVREFLVTRLSEEIGDVAVLQMHGDLGRRLESSNWFASAWHYRASGDADAVVRVIDRWIPSIVALGSFEPFRQFLDGTCGSTNRPAALVLRSRLELERGNFKRAVELAQAAAEAAVDTGLVGLALLNLTAVLARHGFDERAISLASQALRGELEPAQRMVAEASVALWITQQEGNLETVGDQLHELARQQDLAGHRWYAGVTRVNLAVLLLWLGRPAEAVLAATRAESDLSPFPVGPERVAAAAVRMTARVQLGDVDELDALTDLVNQANSPTARDEAAVEAARAFADYGAIEKAAHAASLLDAGTLAAGYFGAWAVVTGTIALRRGEPEAALSYAQAAQEATVQDAAGKFRALLLRTRAQISVAGEVPRADLAELIRIGRAQRSRLLGNLAELLDALAGSSSPDSAIARLLPEETHVLSVLAEECVRILPTLGSEASERVRAEAHLRPERWRSALRLVFAGDPKAARLLADIGDSQDVVTLRAAATTRRWLRPVAASITRRLARKVHIEDLGVVRIVIGGQPLERTIRRKVVALLCFLSSRPGMAATKDEALEALWSDLGPDTATNSLHQTIYYLRRVFEPDFREGMSAGYVQFDGDVVTLDGDLVDSTSRVCWRLVASSRSGNPQSLDLLIEAYSGTYALDFAYEDWATNYRDNLHAAVLAVAEEGVRASTAAGDLDTSIRLAQHVLAVDPTADAVELELLRAYKAGGRNAAAAEQYAHYASFVRSELGSDPPPFAEI